MSYQFNFMDIVERRYHDGFVQVGMIVDRMMNCGAPMYKVMFEATDNGVEICWYSAGAMYEYGKVN